MRESAAEWLKDKAPQQGAAIAYYTMISLAPLLVIAIAIGGAVFGAEAARGEIVGQISALVGKDAAQAIQNILEHAQERPRQGTAAGILGVIVLLVGAAAMFVQLQESLNTIWQVRPKLESAFWSIAKKYLFSFGIVVGIGFLLLVSLLVSALLSAIGGFFADLVPGIRAGQFLNQAFSWVVITLLIALMFKVVPDVCLVWRDVWGGAALTSALFVLGKFAIGFYLGQSTIVSAYGAAGSLVVLLIWVYFSTQIMLFGVEFVKCQKRARGSRVVPESHAERR